MSFEKITEKETSKKKGNIGQKLGERKKERQLLGRGDGINGSLSKREKKILMKKGKKKGE